MGIHEKDSIESHAVNEAPKASPKRLFQDQDAEAYDPYDHEALANELGD